MRNLPLARLERLATAYTPGTVRFAPEESPFTMLFADISGFTTVSETKAPEEVAEFLSNFFSAAVDAIFAYGGTLDKFIGDAIMALWGAPIAHADDPDRALRAAREWIGRH